jgi:hypothetical protein
MPWVENEEDIERREKWQAEQQAKNAIQNAAFSKLTRKQKDALRDLWKAYDQWDRQTTDQFLLYETVLQLQSVRSAFITAFPALTADDDDE